MKKVLLVGGAGFLGMTILKHLCERFDYSVTIIDNFFRGKHDIELNHLVNQYRIKIIESDCTDYNTFKKLDQDYDDVYMLASIVGVKYALEAPDEIIRVNTSIILNTLEWVKNTHCKKVLFSSSSECYAGATERFNYPVPTDESVPVCIEDIKNPRFTYAATKILGESAFLNYSNMHGFNSTIIRYHNIYGPRMGFRHVIPEVIYRIFNHENPFRMFGGGQSRAFCYAEDAAELTVSIMESDKSNSEIVHVGNSMEEIKIKDLIFCLFDIAGYHPEIDEVSAPAGADAVSRRCPDTGKMNSIVGGYDFTELEIGLEKTFKWYRDYLASGNGRYE